LEPEVREFLREIKKGRKKGGKGGWEKKEVVAEEGGVAIEGF